MKIQKLILFPILSASASNAYASSAPSDNNNLGLDAATLRALGLADDSSLDLVTHDDDEDVLEPYDRDVEGSDTYVDEDDTDDTDEGGAWWRDPLAQFEDEGDSGGIVIDTAILKPMMKAEQLLDDEDEENVRQHNDEDEEGAQSGLSEDAQRRLAERSIVPADDDDYDDDGVSTTNIDYTGGQIMERSKTMSAKDVSATIAAPLTFLLPASFPKLRSLLTSMVGGTPVNVLISVVTAQYMMMYLASSRKKSGAKNSSAGAESPIETVSNGGYTDNMYNVNEEVGGGGGGVVGEGHNTDVSKRRLGALFSNFGGAKQQTIDDLSAELQTWIDSAEKKDMHNSMLRRENEDVLLQVSDNYVASWDVI